MDETQQCDNCKRDVPAASYERHNMFCFRNNMLCDQCGEVILKTQKDAHLEEFHVPVTCECGKEIEKSKIDVHKDTECNQRTEICPYCQLAIKIAEKMQHESYCGTRTEKCESCNRYIKLQDFEQHFTSNCEYPPKPQPVQGFQDDYIDLLGGAGGGGAGGPMRRNRTMDSDDDEGEDNDPTWAPDADDGDDANAEGRAERLLGGVGVGDVNQMLGMHGMGVTGVRYEHTNEPLPPMPKFPSGDYAKDEDALTCDACGAVCGDYEKLQIHAFTECPAHVSSPGGGAPKADPFTFAPPSENPQANTSGETPSFTAPRTPTTTAATTTPTTATTW
eukprot:GFYU01009861.1.p1 GENE.GFYU01009861.1~~GFYU01009861.1.p1  ORF type:complete len:333 (+),score=71.59 GFYU01009861.1:143-1141(+)